MMPGGGLEFNCEKPKEQMEDIGISRRAPLLLLTSYSRQYFLC